MKLDFLICGSANESFFSQVAFFKLCLNYLGSPYKEARIVAAFGEYETDSLFERWQQYLLDVDVEWIKPSDGENHGFHLQHYRRYEVMRDDADLVIVCDADVILMSPFQSLLDELCDTPAIAGVIAHYHFPINGKRHDPDADWNKIARASIGRDIARPYRYLFGHNPEESYICNKKDRPHCPFYINYGVLIGTPNLLQQLYVRERELFPILREIVGSWWAPQVGLALACSDLQLPSHAMPLRYNFPNRPEAELLYPGELEKTVFFHYMYGANFTRSSVFAEQDAFEKFVSNKFLGADEIFRRHVVAVTGGDYPFS